MNKLEKLSDETLQEQIRKTHNGSPHGIFSFRKLSALLNELAEYRRPQPENEPLTLEELREIVGPVWICYPQETWGPQHPDKDNMSCSRYKFGFDDYGKTWLAYRRKPERSDG